MSPAPDLSMGGLSVKLDLFGSKNRQSLHNNFLKIANFIETVVYVRPFTYLFHYFEIAILKLELDIFDLKIGILSLEVHKH